MSKHTRTVILAVVISSMITLIIGGILSYFIYKFKSARRLKKNIPPPFFCRETVTTEPDEVLFRQHNGVVKGIIVSEEGNDVLYIRKKIDNGNFSGCFSKVWHNPIGEEVKRMNSRGYNPSISESSISESIQELPLLQESTYANEPAPMKHVSVLIESEPPVHRARKIAPSPPPTPSYMSESSIEQTSSSPAPPPPPPLPRIGNRAPVVGPLRAKPAPPPPPEKTRVVTSVQKPPVPPRGLISKSIRVESSSSYKESFREENVGVPVKLKPLHWDKVIANIDHSMVWNEINDGSFRFDDEQMEALFGYTPTTHKSSNKASNQRNSTTQMPSSQIFLLDPRKSQNVAIVLRSLAISRKEILDALLEGKGLNTDTLEKLTKICPTQEEITKILQFNGNPTKLPDAESFLYHILKSVPSAFTRFDAMLFRSTYDSEMLHIKDSLQTLELACKELRSGGIFYKLLEAILKAGNRMNAGTARGNAKGFNLTSLRRLSDVKSTDGKTTLLYFVVEQVIRSEGKKDIRHNFNTKNYSDQEYLTLGLPVVARLSNEFVNVKKSAAIDYGNFKNACLNLSTRVKEMKNVVRYESGGFLKEMKGFVEDCEEELLVVREDEMRVFQVVRKTTVYYQAGAMKENGMNLLQLFVIVKDFLSMVDQVCSEIGKKVEKMKVVSVSSSPPLSPTANKSPMRFHNLQNYFKAQRQGNSSSDSEDDFS